MRLAPVEEDFARSVVDGVATDAGLSVYADWLEEHGRLADAARVQNGQALAVALEVFFARDRPAYEETHRFVADALAAAGVLSVWRGIPWCECKCASASKVLVLGAIYSASLSLHAFYITFERISDGRPWEWTLGFDALESSESLLLSSRIHPGLTGDVSEVEWRHQIVGTAAEPLRPAPESLATWQRVFELIISDAEALALCYLLETTGDLHANGHSIDLLSMNTLGDGMVTERGIASLVANLLNARDHGAREYTAYYHCTRGVGPTDEEVARLRAMCKERGVILTDPGGAPV